MSSLLYMTIKSPPRILTVRWFAPTEEANVKKLVDAQGKTVENIKAIIDSLHEFNPMMEHRGYRLAVTYPEIADAGPALKYSVGTWLRILFTIQSAYSLFCRCTGCYKK